MAITFTREPIENADVDLWAPYELAQNRRGDGANTAYLYNDSGVLKLASGKFGISDGNNQGTIENDAVITIDISANSDYTWIIIEARITGGVNVTISATDTAGTDPNALPSSFRNSYDGIKGGFYVNSDRRVIGIVYKTSDAASGLLYVVNTMSTTNGYIGGPDNDSLGIKFLKQSGNDANYYRHLQIIRSILTEGWPARTSAADLTWQHVTWSPELSLFVAVAADGHPNQVMSSPDGINWNSETTPVDRQWASVCWSPELSLFVAVAATVSATQIMSSPDGSIWTSRNGANTNQLLDVCWSPELLLFCAVGISGVGNRVQTSPDGTNWTAQSSAADEDWRAITWSPELTLFVAVASSGVGNRVMTSPDGTNWTIQVSASDEFWRGVAWSPELGLFCASAGLAATNENIMTSVDGITWILRESENANSLNRIVWSPEFGLFCTVVTGAVPNNIQTSIDGINWIERSGAGESLIGVAWAPQLLLFCAVGNTGTSNRVQTSLTIT